MGSVLPLKGRVKLCIHLEEHFLPVPKFFPPKHYQPRSCNGQRHPGVRNLQGKDLGRLRLQSACAQSPKTHARSLHLEFEGPHGRTFLQNPISKPYINPICTQAMASIARCRCCSTRTKIAQLFTGHNGSVKCGCKAARVGQATRKNAEYKHNNGEIRR